VTVTTLSTSVKEETATLYIETNGPLNDTDNTTVSKTIEAIFTDETTYGVDANDSFSSESTTSTTNSTTEATWERQSSAVSNRISQNTSYFTEGLTSFSNAVPTELNTASGEIFRVLFRTNLPCTYFFKK